MMGSGGGGSSGSTDPAPPMTGDLPRHHPLYDGFGNYIGGGGGGGGGGGDDDDDGLSPAKRAPYNPAYYPHQYYYQG